MTGFKRTHDPILANRNPEEVCWRVSGNSFSSLIDTREEIIFFLAADGHDCMWAWNCCSSLATMRRDINYQAEQRRTKTDGKQKGNVAEPLNQLIKHRIAQPPDLFCEINLLLDLQT